MIANEIQPAAFEIIRDQIAAVIAMELSSQYTLSYDTEIGETTVFIEKKNPVDKTKQPAIVVSLGQGTFDNKNYGGSLNGSYTFTIDCFTCADNTDDDDADTLAAKRLHKLLRLCRAILEDPIYKTLNFSLKPVPFVVRTLCSDFQIAQEAYKQDAVATAMGRLNFMVTANETRPLIVAPQINQSITTVLLALSKDGFYFVAG